MCFLKVQCVLSINLFNEKIFIFLWFWLCLVSLFNIIDLVSWIYTLVINSHERYAYIRKRLTVLNSTSGINFSDSTDKHLFKKFVKSYLREDVVLALRLLSRNSQDLIVSEIIANLYKLYKSKQYKSQHYQPNPLLLASQNQAALNPKSKSIVIDETN